MFLWLSKHCQLAFQMSPYRLVLPTVITECTFQSIFLSFYMDTLFGNSNHFQMKHFIWSEPPGNWAGQVLHYPFVTQQISVPYIYNEWQETKIIKPCQGPPPHQHTHFYLRSVENIMSKLTSFLNDKIRCWSITSVVYKILFLPFVQMFADGLIELGNSPLKWNNESQLRWKRNWVGVREYLSLGSLEYCHPFYAERSGKFWWCFCSFLNVNLVSY